VAWVESVKQFSETAPRLTATRSVSVVTIETFAGFYFLDKAVKEIPDVSPLGFCGNASVLRFFP